MIHPGAVRFHRLQREMLTIDAHKHRVVDGSRESRPLAPARFVQISTTAPGYDVGYPVDRNRTLVIVIMAAKDYIYLVVNKDRFEVLAQLLVAAVLRGAVD